MRQRRRSHIAGYVGAVVSIGIVTLGGVCLNGFDVPDAFGARFESLPPMEEHANVAAGERRDAYARSNRSSRALFFAIVLLVLGGFLIRPAARRLRARFDPDTYGGAYLLGLRGLAVVAHGNSSRTAIANAIRLAARGADHRVVERLSERLPERVSV